MLRSVRYVTPDSCQCILQHFRHQKLKLKTKLSSDLIIFALSGRRVPNFSGYLKRYVTVPNAHHPVIIFVFLLRIALKLVMN